MSNEMQIFSFEGQTVLDSRDVAEIIDKRHKNLMRDIDKYVSDLTSSNLSPLDFFIPSTYTDKKGEIRKCYLLTKQGCEFAANKMTGRKGNQFTAQYVTLFNSMETKLRNTVEEAMNKFPIPKTMGEALQLAADQAKQLEAQKPKVNYYDRQMRNPGLMTATEIAKDYGWSASTLNKELHKRGVIFKQGSHWVPYQKYAGKGYTQYEPFGFERGNGRQGVHNNLKWTQKGKKLIYDLLAEDNIKPAMEQMDLLKA